MRYQELLASEELDMILDEGAENARPVANKTLQRMKNAVGLGKSSALTKHIKTREVLFAVFMF